MARPGGSAAVSVERFFQFAVLGLVASGYFAVAGSGYIDTPTIVLTAAGLALRALMIAGVLRFQIPERTVNGITLLYIGFFALDYFLLSRAFLDATVHLVFFLAVVKVLTARTNRDYAYVSTIAFLELLAAAILSANLNFFLFLALYLLSAIAAFSSAEIRRAVERPQKVARQGLRRFHPRLAALACAMTVGILGLTAGLFFMLPRTASAALDRLVSRRIFLPGFSNQVTLGQIGEVKSSSEAVMHVRVSEPRAAANAKWRGAALAEFDGRQWRNPPGTGQMLRIEDGRIVLSHQIERPGVQFFYRIDLNAVDTDTLFFAGTPEVLEVRHSMLVRTPEDNFRLGHVPTQALRYQVYAFAEDPAEAALRQDAEAPAPAERRRYLQLPALDPRIAGLARGWSAGERSDAGRARAIETRLRRDYGYTLELPPAATRDPLAHFLFERRKGHCEYFASAMAVMLRSMDIPARLVTGFQSGVWNPLTELYVIRASDAHSWVEAWLPGRGWTTFDPTPPDPNQTFSLWAKFALYVDAADTFWKEWVLGYDPGQQSILADSLQQSGRSFSLRWFDRLREVPARWRAAAAGATRRYGRTGVMFVLAVGAALWLAPRVAERIRIRLRVARARQGQASTADATLLYLRLLDLLRRRGYQKPSWYTPQEFAATLPAELRALVFDFTQAYNAVRFGADPHAAPRLTMLLDRLEGKHA